MTPAQDFWCNFMLIAVRTVLSEKIFCGAYGWPVSQGSQDGGIEKNKRPGSN